MTSEEVGWHSGGSCCWAPAPTRRWLAILRGNTQNWYKIGTNAAVIWPGLQLQERGKSGGGMRRLAAENPAGGVLDPVANILKCLIDPVAFLAGSAGLAAAAER